MANQFQWNRNETAPAEVDTAAGWVRPKLGEAGCQASIAPSGKRFAFVFDNPGGRGYWWMELPKLPDKPASG